ncbi:transposase [Thermus scotoductus]|uniref:Transposase n=8 Tax=Thermus scotoductus TaxID=37636 RepID=A0A430SB69_THESC|nr:RNA-guided endonuclease TnpB family protein [Thermus scotoductus]RTG93537.1 transposase [Thermus scotoductus]RTH05908.1 transposase [Thermus scotoductus]RTH08592.1 transposase [Thermus scotoductus]RTH12498.1 transposase [Thermus scotoductus]RTH30118.1 transposase [Thermus scotoductus]
MRKAFKYRLYPTKPQVKDLERTLELCRELYNAALQERRDAYKKAGKSVGLYQQKRYLPQIREELPQYKRVHSQVLQDVIHRVDKAFQGFFRRVKAGQKAGYPRFKGKGRYDSFTFPQAYETGVKLQEGGKRVLLYGIGSVKVKLHRPLEGKIKTATVKREGEHWYIIFITEVDPKPLPPSEEAIGIDLGTNPHFLVTSEGEMVEAPRHFQKAEEKLAKAQRELSRKKKGKSGRKKARLKVAKLHRKIANQRRDFHHKVARRLVNAYGTIVHEDLNILALSRSYVAKGIHDAGWAQFLAILAYKAEEAGRRVIKVDPKYTSQDCPVCGHREKKPLWVRAYTCPQCGALLHRDVAAAQNILARAWTGPSGVAIPCPRSPGL